MREDAFHFPFLIWLSACDWWVLINERRGRNLSEVFWEFTGHVLGLWLWISFRELYEYMDETWLYHYDPETKQQSMEWWRSGSPRPAPKNSECKNPLGISRLDFLGSRRNPSHWLSSKGPVYQCGVLLISAGANEGLFEGKTLWEGHQEGLVLARQCPGSPCTCNPEETSLPGLPMSLSPTLFSRSGPIGLPPDIWTEKTIERSPFFVTAAAETWLDGQLSEFFFLMPCKS